MTKQKIFIMSFSLVKSLGVRNLQCSFHWRIPLILEVFNVKSLSRQLSTEPGRSKKDAATHHHALRTFKQNPPNKSTKTSTPTDETTQLSKRKQFKSITADPTVLMEIKQQRLGRRPSARYAEAVDVPIRQDLFTRVIFQAAAKIESSIPPVVPNKPEFAFAGRSNVGKSRLLNRLMGTTIVRVKDKPGLTQSINWFECIPDPEKVGGQGCFAVDMPGYGYAFAGDAKKSTWLPLIETYLKNRSTLKRLFLLIDARHGLKVNDIEFINKLESIRDSIPPYQIVMTKCDLVEQSVLARRHKVTSNTIDQLSSLCKREILMVSSRTNSGIERMRRVIKHMLPPSKIQPAVTFLTTPSGKNTSRNLQNSYSLARNSNSIRIGSRQPTMVPNRKPTRFSHQQTNTFSRIPLGDNKRTTRTPNRKPAIFSKALPNLKYKGSL